jgi:DNA-binding transcriptional LysR family regulator
MMESWDDFRTAWLVARHGTVSGAADEIGVHHATVIRHIDALERRLGTKLFQRHARGYTPTEAGREVLDVAGDAAAQFARLAERLRAGDGPLAGEVVVTSIPGLAARFAPVLVEFQLAHPALSVRFLTETRLFRLELAEAHVAIRAGARPDDPDSVVQPFGVIRHGLWAARGYAARRGLPAGVEEFGGHRFIMAEGPAAERAPHYRWLAGRIDPAAVCFRSTEPAALHEALLAGAGIGFAPLREAAAQGDLVAVMAPQDDWDTPLWLVTHVDIHRSAKVRALLADLKRAQPLVTA